MIALTWVLDLPLATDPAKTRTRAEQLGGVLTQSEGLLAGFVGVAEAGVDEEAHNRLALLSVWANSSRMAQFLWGDAMATIEHDLARPRARLWSVSSVQVDRKRLEAVTHAGVSLSPAVDEPLVKRVDEHRGAVDRAVAGRSTALAARGFDTATWTEVSLDAWKGRPRAYAGQVFQVVAGTTSIAQ